MKKLIALMCVSALVMGLSGLDAEAKVKRVKGRKIAKTERVVKKTDVACDKAKADCAKACEAKKAECKDAKACEAKKAECKDAKACEKTPMKEGRPQLLNKSDMKLKENGKAVKDIKACDKAKAECDGCEKKAECSHQNPCCKEGPCKKDASCGKEKCKANPEACCK